MSKCSVALCTFNGERFLREQLDSILNQSIPVDEIIIGDDGSTDKTLEILDTYKLQFKGLSIMKALKPLGAIKNFERVIEACTGDLIFLSDQDDIWHKDKVKVMRNYFDLHPKALFLFTDGNLIDAEGTFLQDTLWAKWGFNAKVQRQWQRNSSAFEQLLTNINKATGATTAFRKELKASFMPINVPEGYWHDNYIALHAAAQNGLRFIPEKLIWYRIHAGQQVGVTSGPKKDAPIHNNQYVSIKDFRSRIKAVYPVLFLKSRLYRKTVNLIHLLTRKL